MAATAVHDVVVRSRIDNILAALGGGDDAAKMIERATAVVARVPIGTSVMESVGRGPVTSLTAATVGTPPRPTVVSQQAGQPERAQILLASRYAARQRSKERRDQSSATTHTIKADIDAKDGEPRERRGRGASKEPHSAAADTGDDRLDDQAPETVRPTRRTLSPAEEEARRQAEAQRAVAAAAWIRQQKDEQSAASKRRQFLELRRVAEQEAAAARGRNAVPWARRQALRAAVASEVYTTLLATLSPPAAVEHHELPASAELPSSSHAPTGQADKLIAADGGRASMEVSVAGATSSLPKRDGETPAPTTARQRGRRAASSATDRGQAGPTLLKLRRRSPATGSGATSSPPQRHVGDLDFGMTAKTLSAATWTHTTRAAESVEAKMEDQPADDEYGDDAFEKSSHESRTAKLSATARPSHEQQARAPPRQGPRSSSRGHATSALALAAKKPLALVPLPHVLATPSATIVPRGRSKADGPSELLQRQRREAARRAKEERLARAQEAEKRLLALARVDVEARTALTTALVVKPDGPPFHPTGRQRGTHADHPHREANSDITSPSQHDSRNDIARSRRPHSAVASKAAVDDDGLDEEDGEAEAVFSASLHPSADDAVNDTHYTMDTMRDSSHSTAPDHDETESAGDESFEHQPSDDDHEDDDEDAMLDALTREATRLAETAAAVRAAAEHHQRADMPARQPVPSEGDVSDDDVDDQAGTSAGESILLGVSAGPAAPRQRDAGLGLTLRGAVEPVDDMHAERGVGGVESRRTSPPDSPTLPRFEPARPAPVESIARASAQAPMAASGLVDPQLLASDSAVDQLQAIAQLRALVQSLQEQVQAGGIPRLDGSVLPVGAHEAGAEGFASSSTAGPSSSYAADSEHFSETDASASPDQLRNRMQDDDADASGHGVSTEQESDSPTDLALREAMRRRYDELRRGQPITVRSFSTSSPSSDTDQASSKPEDAESAEPHLGASLADSAASDDHVRPTITSTTSSSNGEILRETAADQSFTSEHEDDPYASRSPTGASPTSRTAVRDEKPASPKPMTQPSLEGETVRNAAGWLARQQLAGIVDDGLAPRGGWRLVLEQSGLDQPGLSAVEEAVAHHTVESAAADDAEPTDRSLTDVQQLVSQIAASHTDTSDHRSAAAESSAAAAAPVAPRIDSLGPHASDGSRLRAEAAVRYWERQPEEVVRTDDANEDVALVEEPPLRETSEEAPDLDKRERAVDASTSAPRPRDRSAGELQRALLEAVSNLERVGEAELTLAEAVRENERRILLQQSQAAEAARAAEMAEAAAAAEILAAHETAAAEADARVVVAAAELESGFREALQEAQQRAAAAEAALRIARSRDSMAQTEPARHFNADATTQSEGPRRESVGIDASATALAGTYSLPWHGQRPQEAVGSQPPRELHSSRPDQLPSRNPPNKPSLQQHASFSSSGGYTMDEWEDDDEDEDDNEAARAAVRAVTRAVEQGVVDQRMGSRSSRSANPPSTRPSAVQASVSESSLMSYASDFADAEASAVGASGSAPVRTAQHPRTTSDGIEDDIAEGAADSSASGMSEAGVEEDIEHPSGEDLPVDDGDAPAEISEDVEDAHPVPALAMSRAAHAVNPNLESRGSGVQSHPSVSFADDIVSEVDMSTSERVPGAARLGGRAESAVTPLSPAAPSIADEDGDGEAGYTYTMSFEQASESPRRDVKAAQGVDAELSRLDSSLETAADDAEFQAAAPEVANLLRQARQAVAARLQGEMAVMDVRVGTLARRRDAEIAAVDADEQRHQAAGSAPSLEFAARRRAAKQTFAERSARLAMERARAKESAIRDLRRVEQSILSGSNHPEASVSSIAEISSSSSSSLSASQPSEPRSPERQPGRAVRSPASVDVALLSDLVRALTEAVSSQLARPSAPLALPASADAVPRPAVAPQGLAPATALPMASVVPRDPVDDESNYASDDFEEDAEGEEADGGGRSTDHQESSQADASGVSEDLEASASVDRSPPRVTPRPHVDIERPSDARHLPEEVHIKEAPAEDGVADGDDVLVRLPAISPPRTLSSSSVTNVVAAAPATRSPDSDAEEVDEEDDVTTAASEVESDDLGVIAEAAAAPPRDEGADMLQAGHSVKPVAGSPPSPGAGLSPVTPMSDDTSGVFSAAPVRAPSLGQRASSSSKADPPMSAAVAAATAAAVAVATAAAVGSPSVAPISSEVPLLATQQPVVAEPTRAVDAITDSILSGLLSEALVAAAKPDDSRVALSPTPTVEAETPRDATEVVTDALLGHLLHETIGTVLAEVLAERQASLSAALATMVGGAVVGTHAAVRSSAVDSVPFSATVPITPPRTGALPSRGSQVLLSPMSPGVGQSPTSPGVGASPSSHSSPRSPRSLPASAPWALAQPITITVAANDESPAVIFPSPVPVPTSPLTATSPVSAHSSSSPSSSLSPRLLGDLPAFGSKARSVESDNGGFRSDDEAAPSGAAGVSKSGSTSTDELAASLYDFDDEDQDATQRSPPKPSPTSTPTGIAPPARIPPSPVELRSAEVDSVRVKWAAEARSYAQAVLEAAASMYRSEHSDEEVGSNQQVLLDWDEPVPMQIYIEMETATPSRSLGSQFTPTDTSEPAQIRRKLMFDAIVSRLTGLKATEDRRREHCKRAFEAAAAVRGLGDEDATQLLQQVMQMLSAPLELTRVQVDEVATAVVEQGLASVVSTSEPRSTVVAARAALRAAQAAVRRQRDGQVAADVRTYEQWLCSEIGDGLADALCDDEALAIDAAFRERHEACLHLQPYSWSLA